nr:hypothetical protein [Tanacetum cinerariifolium]
MKLKGNSVDTKFAKTSVLGKPVLQSLRNQSVVRQLNEFKSKMPQMSKPRVASQVDVNNNLSRPITQHYFPKKRESVFAKPDHMITSSSSRNSSKNMPRFSSNDMVYNYYLEEAKKKTQEINRNSKSSVMHTASPQNTTKGSKPKPKSNNQTSRSLPEVNSRAMIQSHKTRNSNKLVDQKSHTQKPSRQIFTGHRFSPNKTSAVYEKTSPRSDLRWKPTGRIFKYVGHRWIPIGKLFDSCTSKVNIEPPHGSIIDIPNIHECKQTLDVNAGTSINVQKEQSLDLSAVVSKSFGVTTADAPHQRQQQHTTQSTSTTVAVDTPPLNIQTTPETTCQEPTQVPTITATKIINQAETITENAQVEDDEFINIFCTPVQERRETSSSYVDSSNMHTFYQRHPFEHRWTKDHLLE